MLVAPSHMGLHPRAVVGVDKHSQTPRVVRHDTGATAERDGSQAIPNYIVILQLQLESKSNSFGFSLTGFVSKLICI